MLFFVNSLSCLALSPFLAFIPVFAVTTCRQKMVEDETGVKLPVSLGK
jgi:hypothetical protein